jgi:1,4-alpha-glucan branching enzyme
MLNGTTTSIMPFTASKPTSGLAITGTSEPSAICKKRCSTAMSTQGSTPYIANGVTNSIRAIKPSQLVVFSQNHDQVGNRMLGERSSVLLNFDAQKLSAAVVVLSPYLPLLFMGEEYGETAPFLYFTSHAEPALAEAVRAGRRAEFSAFHWQGDMPDPQAESTFLRSKLDHGLCDRPQRQVLWRFYRKLIELRKNLPALRELDATVFQVSTCEPSDSLLMHRSYLDDEVVLFFNFGDRQARGISELSSATWQECWTPLTPNGWDQAARFRRNRTA